ncbi:DUF2063 domain-containing protein [Agrobacterium sp. a22-2]|uniref:HvfC/BufC N-terminal domain-containing protein n=1 Tax=Agrobacterium sp. a22-2 TaxID=2283840 RepID=UPI001444E7E5|nr:DNA-binding domain-containing protein [Agrobacterium sp. a22-2]NKN36058.1 DUF2063 domain-containing protein [Agrobacterium sp. a22-2]
MDFATSQASFIGALLHSDRPLPDGITTARGEADTARFAVYRNNVFVGLTRALAQNFPVTARLVGSDFFAAMARIYAQDRRPSTPLMMDYGRDFPEFIAQFPPAQALAYLPDIARIEIAWRRAYHAADAIPLALADIAAIAPASLGDLRLVPHPSASLIGSNYPIGSIWNAHQQEMVRPPASWQPETVLIVRPEMTVEVIVLAARDAVFAAALFGAETLAEAAEAALVDDTHFDFGTALTGLISLGAFSPLAP